MRFWSLLCLLFGVHPSTNGMVSSKAQGSSPRKLCTNLANELQGPPPGTELSIKKLECERTKAGNIHIETTRESYQPSNFGMLPNKKHEYTLRSSNKTMGNPLSMKLLRGKSSKMWEPQFSHGKKDMGVSNMGKSSNYMDLNGSKCCFFPSHVWWLYYPLVN